MADLTPFVEMSLFSGVNNVDDPVRLTPVPTADNRHIWPLQVASNVIIDNTRRLKTRPGYSRVIVATNPHSLFATADEERAYFVEDDKLYLINSDYSVTQLLSGLARNVRMSYVEINGEVWFSNGHFIGYIDADNVVHSLSDPETEFKISMRAGNFLEYYNGRLYSAKGSVLWYSDPMAFGRVDMRRGFMQFDSDITMVRAVDDGMYVADGKVHFLAGKSPLEFTKTTILQCGVIPYTDVAVDGALVEDGQQGEKYAYFVTTDGIVRGDSKGKALAITEPRYAMGSYVEGAGVIVNEHDWTAYIATLS